MRAREALGRLSPDLQRRWHAVGEAYTTAPSVRLAVSGGPDSLAMLIGFAALRDQQVLNGALDVVTVDHGLRPESADEAKMVVDVCQSLGVACRIATLCPPDDVKNKQAWARQARYLAMVDPKRQGTCVVLTAHTADDQAETVLMRAARGTGSEGLAAIRPLNDMGPACVQRPFLAWRCEDLQAILKTCPWQPIHDPSNDDEAYTRIRFRRWLADAPAPDSARSIVAGLADTARIAQAENTALMHYANQMVGRLSGSRYGYLHGTVDYAWHPRAVQARFLRSVLAHVAPVDPSAFFETSTLFDLARMMVLAERIEGQSKGRWVGGGAVLDWQEESQDETRFTAFAEAGRSGFATLTLDAGQSEVWDNRFIVTNWASNPMTVRAWASADPPPPWGADLPKCVLASLPVALQGDAVVAFADTPTLQDAFDKALISLKVLKRPLSDNVAP